MVTLAEREAEAILAAANEGAAKQRLRAQADEAAKKRKAEKVERIKESIIETASNAFEGIPEFRRAAVLAVLPDLSNTRPPNDSIRFRLYGAQVETNFFPNDVYQKSRRFLLSLSDNGVRNTFFLTPNIGGFADDPIYGIKFVQEKDGRVDKFYGAKAALKGMALINRIKRLGRS